MLHDDAITTTKVKPENKFQWLSLTHIYKYFLL